MLLTLYENAMYQYNMSFDDMLSPDIPIHVLHQLYHHAQIAYVAAVCNNDLTTAHFAIGTVVNARRAVLYRYGDYEHKHVSFFNEMVIEYNAFVNYVIESHNIIHKQHRPFNFTSGRLVGNAMDQKIIVPRRNRPLEWQYYRDYVNV